MKKDTKDTAKEQYQKYPLSAKEQNGLLVNDSLFSNSIYLILSTGVVAVFGATLISIMTLISSFSILGLGNGLIRYLPTSERKNKKINTFIS